MYDENRLEAFRGDSGLERYRMPARCPELGKYRIVTSDMPLFVVHKAAIQLGLWARQWERRSEIKRRRLGLEMNAKRRETTPAQKAKIAAELTAIARAEVEPLDTLLSDSLKSPVRLDWDMFLKYPDYPLPPPAPPQWPPAPEMPALPREPHATDEAYLPVLDAVDKVVKARREEKERAAAAKFEAAHRKWAEIVQRMGQVHQEQTRGHAQALREMKARHDQAMIEWEAARLQYTEDRRQCLPLIEAKRQAYRLGEPFSVLDHCEQLLALSSYPDFFPQSFDIDYYPATRGLSVDYLIPPLRALPWLKAVEYAEAEDTLRNVLFTPDERMVLYARLLYDIPLRTLHELFAGDEARALKVVRFLGYVFLEENPPLGEPPSCVLSVEVTREAFLALDLCPQNAAECFEQIGGLFNMP